MGRQTVVGGHDGPAIVTVLYVLAAGVYHRLDGKCHAALQLGAFAAIAEVRNAQLALVHRTPDAMPLQLTYDRKAVRLCVPLHRVADISGPRPRTGLSYPAVERLLGHP